jgi:hypothetical protein
MPFTGSSVAIAAALGIGSAIASGMGRSGAGEFDDLPARPEIPSIIILDTDGRREYFG